MPDAAAAVADRPEEATPESEAEASQSIEGSVDWDAATAGVARVRVGSIAADEDRAAGLDVFAVEPLPADSPLRGAPRLVMTPRVAWYSEEASGRMARWTLDDVPAFLDDRPLPHGRLAVPGPARPAERVAG